jgi:hypothetical protein
MKTILTIFSLSLFWLSTDGDTVRPISGRVRDAEFIAFVPVTNIGR